ncbi:ABC transporter ATP-binding protein [Paenibacillus sp. DMB20]|uniref:ABC transporter ATP-binding protein n=1 Tax=Paenibacillus sp. DMB20 TaxID=1642570 RepID=UPI0006282A39|nr:ABC transporter ATP-binding protein [Paenibacillus sp. DMB20]KKO52641.1 ABC transporter ATP-binding protein [Paenibacillus sp. DMB20]
MVEHVCETVVELGQVTKTYGAKKAVDHISLAIQKGSITAILGPNGAGKTTALSMILGLIDPTEGDVKLFGRSPKDRQVKEKIGAMLQEVSVMDSLKAREIIQLIRGYYPHPMEMTELMKLTGLTEEELGKRATKMSGGQKRKLSFALALAGNPELLFFDEPTVGLDTTSRRLFWKTVRSLADKGKTILFTTHYLQEADDIADRIVLFKDGRVVADGTPEEIKSRLTRRSISFVAETAQNLVRERLDALAGVTDVYEQEGRLHLVTENTDQALSFIFREELPVRDVRIEHGSLDEAFEQLTHKQEEAV